MVNFFTPAQEKQASTCPSCPQRKMITPLWWPKQKQKQKTGGSVRGARAKQTRGSPKVNIVTCGIEPVKTETLP